MQVLEVGARRPWGFFHFPGAVDLITRLFWWLAVACLFSEVGIASAVVISVAVEGGGHRDVTPNSVIRLSSSAFGVSSLLTRSSWSAAAASRLTLSAVVLITAYLLEIPLPMQLPRELTRLFLEEQRSLELHEV